MNHIKPCAQQRVVDVIWCYLAVWRDDALCYHNNRLLSHPCYLSSLQFLFDPDLIHILQQLCMEICILWWKSLMKRWLASRQSCCSLLVHIHLCNPEISWVQASADWTADPSAPVESAKWRAMLVVKHDLNLTCLRCYRTFVKCLWSYWRTWNGLVRSLCGRLYISTPERTDEI